MRIPWKSHDGVEWQAHRWRCEESRGAIVCVHGMSGAGEQFHPLPEKIVGFSFYAMDLRGQGKDPVFERRGVMLDFENQLRDIETFLQTIQREHPDEPIFLMGESMGALLSAAYGARLKNHRVNLSGLILSVPVVDLATPVPSVVRGLMRFIATLAPKTRLSPGRFVKSKALSPTLTRDRRYQDSLRAQPHQINNFSMRFLVELGDLIEKSHTFAPAITLPTLVLAAGCDCFVKSTQVEAWFKKIPAGDKTLHIYPEAYHLLWHDWDKDVVIKDIHHWLTSRAGALPR